MAEETKALADHIRRFYRATTNGNHPELSARFPELSVSDFEHRLCAAVNELLILIGAAREDAQ